MEAITEELSNPVWWVTVVIAGVIINLVAAFLFKKMESSVSNVSSNFKHLSEKRKKEREARIVKLRNDKQAVYLASLEEIRNRIRMVQGIVLGGFLFIFIEFGIVNLDIPNILVAALACLSVLCIFISWISHTKSISILSEIRESQES